MISEQTSKKQLRYILTNKLEYQNPRPLTCNVYKFYSNNFLSLKKSIQFEKKLSIKFQFIFIAHDYSYIASNAFEILFIVHCLESHASCCAGMESLQNNSLILIIIVLPIIITIPQ